MNEIFFYTGMVFAIGSFVVSIFLFFSLKIPEAVRYYIRPDSHQRVRKKPVKQQKKVKAAKPEQTEPKKKQPEGKSVGKTEILSDGATEVLHSVEVTEILNSMKDRTELLNIAQNYATAILDADDATEILTEWNFQTEHLAKTK